MRNLMRHPEDSFIELAKQAASEGFPFVAMDEDGSVWGYTTEPSIPNAGGFLDVGLGLAVCLGSIDRGHLDWRRSSVGSLDSVEAARVEAARRGYGWVAKDVDGDVFAFRVQPKWQPMSGIFLSPMVVEQAKYTEWLFNSKPDYQSGWKYPTYDFIRSSSKDEEFFDYFDEMGKFEADSLPRAIEIAELNPLVQYVAMDRDGAIWAYSDEPIVRGEMWDLDDFDNHYAFRLGVIDLGFKDWRQVLVSTNETNSLGLHHESPKDEALTGRMML